jgi:hypothetical protein
MPKGITADIVSGGLYLDKKIDRSLIVMVFFVFVQASSATSARL